MGEPWLMHARLSRRIKRWSLPLYDASSQGSLNQCLLQKLTGLRAQTTTFVPVMMVMCESRHHSLSLRALSKARPIIKNSATAAQQLQYQFPQSQRLHRGLCRRLRPSRGKGRQMQHSRPRMMYKDTRMVYKGKWSRRLVS